MSEWHVYIIRTGLGTLYTGIATDVKRRLAEHEAGGREGAKYLRAKGPLEIVYQCKVGGRDVASKAEHRIKKLSRDRKEKLVEEKPSLAKLLDYLDLSLMEGA